MPTFDNALLDTLRETGDPVADTVVQADFGAGRTAPADLFTALILHPRSPTAGHPGAVTDYYASEPPWPSWARADLIERGQRYFEQWGPQILASLLLASLPDAYAAAKGVQVLSLTARLATDPRRRLLETTQMVVDTMVLGGLAVGARGYATIRRVRLMHGAIRYLIAHDPLVARTCDETVDRRWCPRWGLPVNQEDLLGTLLTFTVVTFEALRGSGVAVPGADAEAYLHTWNVIGYLLGIRPDLLPLDLDTATELRATIRRRQYAPSSAGREMSDALQNFASEAARPRMLAGLPASMSRYLIGNEIAGLLGMPPANWTRVLLTPARRALGALSLDEQHHRLMRALTARFNHAMIQAYLRIERGGDRPRFALPRHLADRWSIPEAAEPPPTATASTGLLAAGGTGKG